MPTMRGDRSSTGAARGCSHVLTSAFRFLREAGEGHAADEARDLLVPWRCVSGDALEGVELELELLGRAWAAPSGGRVRKLSSVGCWLKRCGGEARFCLGAGCCRSA